MTAGPVVKTEIRGPDKPYLAPEAANLEIFHPAALT
jgi:hypothetical protein